MNLQQELDERRQSLRVDMESERIKIAWTDASGETKYDDALCADLSRRGILIEYHLPFTLGELLDITFNHNTDKQNTIKAQVCRCQQQNSENYRTALQII